MALLLVSIGGAGSQVPTAGTGLVSSGTKHAATKVMVVGDSLGWVLGTSAPANLGLSVEAVFQAHCDIIGDRIFTGSEVEVADPGCKEWPSRWKGSLGRSPNAFVMVTGLRQLFDIDDNGKRIVVGTPAWERRYKAAMRRALGTLQSDGPIPVMVFNVPCFDWVQQPTDGEEHNAKRLRTVNRAMKQVAAEFPTVQVVDYSRFVCRGKGGTELIPGVRPDGAHPTVPTVARVWNWLKPQILTAVRKER